jgi:hypothetical protein
MIWLWNAQRINSKELASELPILRFVVKSLISLCNMLSKFYLKDRYMNIDVWWSYFSFFNLMFCFVYGNHPL